MLPLIGFPLGLPFAVRTQAQKFIREALRQRSPSDRHIPIANLGQIMIGCPRLDQNLGGRVRVISADIQPERDVLVVERNFAVRSVRAKSSNEMQGGSLACTHSDCSPFRKIDGDTMRPSAIAPAQKVKIAHVSVSFVCLARLATHCHSLSRSGSRSCSTPCPGF